MSLSHLKIDNSPKSPFYDFIAEYVSYMLACGVHTARVISCATRICEANDLRMRLMTTSRSVVLSITDTDGNCETRVMAIENQAPSFRVNALLSRLSWQAYDEGLRLDELRREFQRIKASPRFPFPWVLTLVSIANACFCCLFGGDFMSCMVVAVATLAGFWLKRTLTSHGISRYIVFVLSSFTSSLIASVSILLNCNADIAIATSVLFLIPGVVLISGMVDTADGHILVGVSRLIDASLLILCIAIGLAFTLLLVKNSLIY